MCITRDGAERKGLSPFVEAVQQSGISGASFFEKGGPLFGGIFLQRDGKKCFFGHGKPKNCGQWLLESDSGYIVIRLPPGQCEI
jgi:hypothetical protein